MTFELHPNLAKKNWVIDLPLCKVLIEDNSHYPWLFLVPRRPQIIRLIDLERADQMQLYHELDCAQKILMHIYSPHQLNVAAIGNKTPQLHIHVIARFIHDPAWPLTVWDHPQKSSYAEAQLQSTIQQISEAFKSYFP